MRRDLRKPVPGAVPRQGKIIPFQIPYKGMNARAPYAAMSPEYAILMTNTFVESYGIRTRKGYAEWATNLPGTGDVGSMLSYFPASAAYGGTVPGGTLFAARGASLYNVTLGGAGPWTAEVGVTGTTPYWNGINFQNVAGAFLCLCNEDGGYAYYNGTAWATPTAGAGVGQINGADPATFSYVMEWKKRLWFIPKNSTKAWYLPVEQITGTVTSFDFGAQFKHGGQLQYLVNWTVDGGAGIDDLLVAISSQGDVVIYSGIDPSDPTSFSMQGVWYVGPLPKGRRAVSVTGGDVYILCQYGLIPLSKLLSKGSQEENISLSYNIDPVIARLMQSTSNIQGWQLIDLPKEELRVITIPVNSNDLDYTGAILAYKTLTQTWSVLKDLPVTCMVNVTEDIFAGDANGRVLRAFYGTLDNVQIGSNSGNGIKCQIIPAYQSLENPGYNKSIKLVRPAFLASFLPAYSLQILTNYSDAKMAFYPSLPPEQGALWDSAIWDVSLWAGSRTVWMQWAGCSGHGIVATIQLAYTSGGDTVLTAIDAWVIPGGPM